MCWLQHSPMWYWNSSLLIFSFQCLVRGLNNIYYPVDVNQIFSLYFFVNAESAFLADRCMSQHRLPQKLKKKICKIYLEKRCHCSSSWYLHATLLMIQLLDVFTFWMACCVVLLGSCFQTIQDVIKLASPFLWWFLFSLVWFYKPFLHLKRS